MTYTIQPGDSLWAIAAVHLGSGDRWPEIAAANRIHHPDLIRAGDTLEIPAGAEYSAAADTLAAETIGPAAAPLALALAPGWFISSGFGPRSFPGVAPHFHSGVDLAGMAAGSRIEARAPVRVALSAIDPHGYGHYSIVEAAGGGSWLFGHLDRPGAAAGSLIEAGGLIGLIGSSGFSTGPHLHLEYRPRGMGAAAADPTGHYRIDTL